MRYPARSGSTLAFHVNVAPHTVLDHNTRTLAMAFIQFTQYLLVHFSAADTRVQAKPITPMLDSILDCLLTLEKRLRREPIHSDAGDTQCVCRRKRRNVRTKIQQYEGEAIKD